MNELCPVGFCYASVVAVDGVARAKLHGNVQNVGAMHCCSLGVVDKRGGFTQARVGQYKHKLPTKATNHVVHSRYASRPRIFHGLWHNPAVHIA